MDLIYIVASLVYAIYHRAAAKKILIKEIYGIDPPPALVWSRCLKKSRSILPSQAKSESDPHTKYKDAEERLKIDLDLVRIIEEINALKFFVAVSSKGTDFAPRKSEVFTWLLGKNGSQNNLEPKLSDKDLLQLPARKFSKEPNSSGATPLEFTNSAFSPSKVAYRKNRKPVLKKPSTRLKDATAEKEGLRPRDNQLEWQ